MRWPPSAAPIMASGCCRASASAGPAGAPSSVSSPMGPAGGHQERFIRETIFGPRRSVRSYQITTDPATLPPDTLPPDTLPPETTWDLMTNQPGTIERTVGNTFGLRTWIEYGFKHAKDDLGWADYRLTDSAAIERWWELVMSAYTLVSLQTPDVAALGHLGSAPAVEPAADDTPAARSPTLASLQSHPAWDPGSGWKQHLNNLRLLLQPYVCSCLLLRWLAPVPLLHVQSVQTGLAAPGF